MDHGNQNWNTTDVRTKRCKFKIRKTSDYLDPGMKTSTDPGIKTSTSNSRNVIKTYANGKSSNKK